MSNFKDLPVLEPYFTDEEAYQWCEASRELGTFAEFQSAIRPVVNRLSSLPIHIIGSVDFPKVRFFGGEEVRQYSGSIVGRGYSGDELVLLLGTGHQVSISAINKALFDAMIYEVDET